MPALFKVDLRPLRERCTQVAEERGSAVAMATQSLAMPPGETRCDRAVRASRLSGRLVPSGNMVRPRSVLQAKPRRHVPPRASSRPKLSISATTIMEANAEPRDETCNAQARRITGWRWTWQSQSTAIVGLTDSDKKGMIRASTRSLGRVASDRWFSRALPSCWGDGGGPFPPA